MKNVKFVFTLLAVFLVSSKRDYKCELYEAGLVVDIVYVNDLYGIETNSESANSVLVGGVWNKY